MFCGDDSIIGRSDTVYKVSKLLCRRWTCDECFQHRCRELRSLAASGDPTTLITLTVKASRFDTEDEAARALVRAWRNIRQRAQREGYAETIPFLAVVEETKKGWPHLHILARAPYIPQQWLSERMAEYCDSPIVHITRIRSRRHAARYVAKYVSKSPVRYEGTKRYWRSRDYSDWAARSAPASSFGLRWKRADLTFEAAVSTLQSLGFVAIDRTDFTALMAPPWLTAEPEQHAQSPPPPRGLNRQKH